MLFNKKRMIKTEGKRMDKTTNLVAIGALLIIGVFLATSVMAGPKVKPQCNDGVDNDGDGKIDMQDAGCSSRTDNDESNCGDGVCTGAETYSSCPADCKRPDSCSDTDGGYVLNIQGTVNGYQNGNSFSYTDVCVDNAKLVEYTCFGGGTAPYAYNVSCVGANYTSCSSGACA